MIKKALEEIEAKQTVGFIKVSEKPVLALSDEQKVMLNRRGNVLFNEGSVEDARRIFLTTGYSDGLTRVGDAYLAKKQELDALKLYLLAHNQRKAGPLIEKLAQVISNIIKN
ncbi:MAG: hypothetical protein LBS97_02320 [Treponema sp.]|jgi:hypothetical protein|nr:hypothetical protein [Treponema sp.]